MRKQAAGDAMSQDNEAASTARWWVFLISFEIFATVLILVLHRVAFGAGLLKGCQGVAKGYSPATTSAYMVPIIQPGPGLQSPTDQDKCLVGQASKRVVNLAATLLRIQPSIWKEVDKRHSYQENAFPVGNVCSRKLSVLHHLISCL